MRGKQVDAIIPRPNARKSVREMLEDYAGARYASETRTLAPDNVALIVGTGLSGKTTFLTSDVLPLIRDAHGEGLLGRFGWVYVPCDIDVNGQSKAAMLFELCCELNRAGFETPTTKAALMRYDKLIGGGLEKFLGEAWRASISAVAKVGIGLFAARNLAPAIGAVLESLPIDDPSLAAVAGALRALQVGVAQAGNGVSDLSSIMTILGDSFGLIAKRVPMPGGSTVLDFSPLFGRFDPDQLLKSLETALMLDLAAQDERIPLIVFDGAEALMHGSPVDGTLWLNRLTSCAGAFFILSSRVVPNYLHKYREIDLDAIGSDEFAEMLGSRFVLNSDDRSLLEMASDLPGLLAMYAEGVREGIWARDYRDRIFHRQTRSHRTRRLRRRVTTPGIEEVARAIVAEWARALKEVNGGRDWQLIATLAWIPDWNTRVVASRVPVMGGYSECIGDITGYTFVQAVGDGPTYRIHPSVAAYVRELTRPETWDAVDQSFRGLLACDDQEIRQRAVETLVGLDAHKIRFEVQSLIGDVPVMHYFDSEEIRGLLTSAQKVLDDDSDDDGRGKTAKLVTGLIEDMATLLGLRRDYQRAWDPDKALRTAELVADVRCFLRDRVGKARGHAISSVSLEDATLAWADALRGLGAIYSDHYRNTSDISFHLMALRCEIMGLQALSSVMPKAIDGAAKAKGADVFAGCVNSVGTSCMRLKRYDVALPMLSLAKALTGVAGNGISKRLAGFVENNYATCLYDYGTDVGSAGMSYVHASDVELTASGVAMRSDMLSAALKEYEGVVQKGLAAGNPRWDPWANYANCLVARGDYGQARRELDALRASITAKNGACESNYMARQLIVRARLELSVARRADEGGNPQQAEDAFRAARVAAVDSLAIKLKTRGKQHLDVRKADELIREIDAAIDGSQLTETQRGALKKEHHNVYSECQKSMSYGLDAAELAGRIARGDPIDLCDMFALTDEEYREGFGATQGPLSWGGTR